jgi:hypothetical protein
MSIVIPSLTPIPNGEAMPTVCLVAPLGIGVVEECDKLGMT